MKLSAIWSNKRRSGFILILLGTALFVYGVLSFDPSGSGNGGFNPLGAGGGPYSYGSSYSREARLEAVLGAVLVVSGAFRYRATD